VARLTLLVAELDRLPKPYLLKINSPVGQSTDEGHDLLSLAIPQWEPDAFKFLDDFLRRRPSLHGTLCFSATVAGYFE
jgi:hypothetical protein